MIAGGQTQMEQGVNKEQFKPVDNGGIRKIVINGQHIHLGIRRFLTNNSAKCSRLLLRCSLSI